LLDRASAKADGLVNASRRTAAQFAGRLALVLVFLDELELRKHFVPYIAEDQGLPSIANNGPFAVLKFEF
jgi:hypothetical protein